MSIYRKALTRPRALGRAIASRLSRVAALATVAFVTLTVAPGLVYTLHAQSVSIQGPPGLTLTTVTPAFTVRILGAGTTRPLTVMVQVSTSADFSTGLVIDTTLVTSDTVVQVQTTRALPGETKVYWRARAQSASLPLVDSPVAGPRTVPAWVALLDPNSVAGDVVDTRRPLFVWRSPSVSPLAGTWTYELQITTVGRPVQGATIPVDTTWRAIADLQTNTSYRWSVRASLRGVESVTANSLGTFSVRDPALPAKTLLYQNFPNPFPSPAAFATCIWFDVAPPGARITLDVTDLRGNLVRTLIPGPDGQRDFLPGRYGQGLPGTGSSCDNRFVWDGTGTDGRTVAAGVYLLRFQSGRNAPTFRRMMFVGR